jgi:hypothetical protein
MRMNRSYQEICGLEVPTGMAACFSRVELADLGGGSVTSRSELFKSCAIGQ